MLPCHISSSHIVPNVLPLRSDRNGCAPRQENVECSHTTLTSRTSSSRHTTFVQRERMSELSSVTLTCRGVKPAAAKRQRQSTRLHAQLGPRIYL